MKRHYMKEEEFLDDFPGAGPAISQAVNGDYEPDYDCNDQTRHNKNYFLKSGELLSLVFKDAWIYYEAGCFISARIALESSKRVVTLKITLSKEAKLGYHTEIVADTAI